MYENEIASMREELKVMQEFAEDKSAEEQAELLEIRLTTLNSYMARSGRLMAESKLIRDKIKDECYTTYIDKIVALKPSIVKDFINAKCAEANSLVSGFERLNHDLKHISDNIRTQISYEKKMVDLSIRAQNYMP